MSLSAVVRDRCLLVVALQAAAADSHVLGNLEQCEVLTVLPVFGLFALPCDIFSVHEILGIAVPYDVGSVGRVFGVRFP